MRRPLMQSLGELPQGTADLVDFLEFAPENWIGLGGRWAKMLRAHTERFDCIAHGLSLSIGSPAPLDMELLGRIKVFMREHGIAHYSEHLSYTSDHAQLYELMPIPFTLEAARYVADRIAQVQDFLGIRMAIEHVSYYLAPGAEMSEAEFVCEVVRQADCNLLLDVNNVYCNAWNHSGDCDAFLDAMPAERIAYLHLAGHRLQDDGVIIDTHGAPVSEPVWELLANTYSRFGAVPTLLERDYNFPPLPDLLNELARVRKLQTQATQSPVQVASAD